MKKATRDLLVVIMATLVFIVMGLGLVFAPTAQAAEVYQDTRDAEVPYLEFPGVTSVSIYDENSIEFSFDLTYAASEEVSWTVSNPDVLALGDVEQSTTNIFGSITISSKATFNVLDAGISEINVYNGPDLVRHQTVFVTKDKVSLTTATISGIEGQYEYSGKPVEPPVSVTVGDKVLVKDKDYTADYENNNAVGTGRVVIKGIGGYTGTRVVPFEIVAPKYYQVSFNSNGGSTVKSEEVKEGNSAIIPAQHKKDGFDFVGWFVDRELTVAYDFSSEVTGDLTLYAKWEKIPAVYSVKFESNGGSAVTEEKITEGDTAFRPADPSRPGYTFKGWYSDKGLTKAYDFSAKVTGDLTLYARWEKIPVVYSVKFESNGGSAVVEEKVTEGDAASRPQDPSRPGYTFKGWYSDKGLSKAYDFSSKVTGDLTLYAKWEKAAAKITFSDVAVGDEANHASDVIWLAEQGISEGWKVGDKREFRGMESVARADMAAFLYRMAGSPEFAPSAKVKAMFSDVDETTPHAKEIWWLADSGISKGFGDGTFRPYATVARQDMAAFLHRLATKLGKDGKGTETISFSDVSHGDDANHAGDVEWLARNGISKGWQSGDRYEFRGLQPVARQDMAAFLHRLDSNVLKR